jgi:hypothetical protein
MATVEDNLVVLQKIRCRISISCRNSTTGYKCLKTENQTESYTLMFTASLFTMTKRWKQIKCPTTDECINKIYYTQTMAYYAASKESKIK